MMKALLIFLMYTFIFNSFAISSQTSQISSPFCLDLEVELTSIKWSPDDEWVAIGGNGGIYLFDSSFENNQNLSVNADDFVITLDWNDTGSQIAALYTNGDIMIWDISTKEVVTHIETNLVRPADLDWNFNNEKIAINNEYGQILIYNLNDSLLYPIELDDDYLQMGNLQWHTNNTWLVFDGGFAIVIWDTESNMSIERIYTNNSLLATWNPVNTDSLILAGQDPTHMVFPNQVAIYSWDLITRDFDILGIYQEQTGTSSTRLYSFAWQPIGQFFAVHSLDGKIRVWKFGDKNIQYEIEAPERFSWGDIRTYNGLAWSNKGNRLGDVGVDGQACIWDMSHLE